MCSGWGWCWWIGVYGVTLDDTWLLWWDESVWSFRVRVAWMICVCSLTWIRVGIRRRLLVVRPLFLQLVRNHPHFHLGRRRRKDVLDRDGRLRLLHQLIARTYLYHQCRH